MILHLQVLAAFLVFSPLGELPRRACSHSSQPMSYHARHSAKQQTPTPPQAARRKKRKEPEAADFPANTRPPTNAPKTTTDRGSKKPTGTTYGAATTAKRIGRRGRQARAES